MLPSSLGNNSNKNNMKEVVDTLIKERHVKDVTEDCKAHASVIQNVVPVDRFLKSDAENFAIIRY